MRGTVIVVFPRDREYELRLTAGDKPLPTAQEGDQWLSQQFEELGCTPRSLVGKVLVLDKVLEVAREAGEKRFAGDIAWAERYARAVLATLNRENVRVDIAENTVG
ncbi:MAG: hypothetical protein A3F75_10640 [Betaproteobacteria bacterium RIFCSPLOWO2_12_FULL_64_23]|nr:MAG: hypothetical protein A3F75_10640 [Betaproteobacteria bacterium RIFCSPLOWO2_12_FULL_64_23]